MLYELVVPFLSEASYKGFLEVFVERLTAFFALVYGATADVPLVVVDGFEFAKILYANRI